MDETLKAALKSKTALVAILFVAWVAVQRLHLAPLDPDTASAIDKLFVGAFMLTLRHAVAKATGSPDADAEDVSS